MDPCFATKTACLLAAWRASGLGCALRALLHSIISVEGRGLGTALKIQWGKEREREARRETETAFVKPLI